MIKADFPDWFSPMLVKELRQGLKKKLFTILFILFQVSMVVFFCLILIEYNAFLNNRNEYTFSTPADTMNELFWFMVGIKLLIIMPLRGLWAISSESHANTLELIQLTHLSTWNIIWGKWVSIFFQIILISISILPYMILRYLFGSVNLVEDLMVFMLIITLSSVASAFFVGVSNTPTWLKSLLIIGYIFGLFVFLGVISFDSSFSRMLETTTFLGWLYFLMIVSLVTIFCLNIGSLSIATSSDNSERIQRLLSIVLIGLFIFLAIAYNRVDVGEFLAMSGMGVIFLYGYTLAFSISMTTQPTRANVIVFRPLQWLLRCFYPSWQSGVRFCCLAILIPLVTLLITEPQDWDEIILGFLIILNVIIAPRFFLELFNWRPKYPLIVYGFFQLAFLIIFLFVMVFAEANNFKGAYLILVVFPPATLGLIPEWNTMRGSLEIFYISQIVYLFVVLAVLHRQARPYWARIKELEREKAQKSL